MSDARRFYLPELDGVRFLAFFLVFLFHGQQMWGDIPFAAQIEYGWIGVDLFFVLSSFLITSLLLKEIALHRSLDLLKFWMRRSLRIWPLYFLAVGAYVFVFPRLGLQFLSPSINSVEYESFLSTYILPLSLFYFNWTIVEVGWQPLSGVNDLWSVAMEEQFYLVWPILMKLVRVKYLVHLFLAILGVAICMRIYTTGQPDWVQTFANTIARLDAFVFGGLIAVLYRNEELFKSLAGRGGYFAAAAVLIVLLGTSVGPPVLDNTRHAIWQYLCIDLGVATFVLAVLTSPTLTKLFSARPLVWLGKLSYGFYVFHRLGLSLAWSVVPSPETPGLKLIHALIALTSTGIISALSYYCFESLFLRLKERFTKVQSRPV